MVERKGDHYKCPNCDRFSIHKGNENVCANQSCPSNTSEAQFFKKDGGIKIF